MWAGECPAARLDAEQPRDDVDVGRQPLLLGGERGQRRRPLRDARGHDLGPHLGFGTAARKGGTESLSERLV